MIHRFVSKQEQIECDIVAIIYRWSVGQLFVQMTMLYLHASLVGEEGMGPDNAQWVTKGQDISAKSYDDGEASWRTAEVQLSSRMTMFGQPI